jgi:hypothetical protein
LPIGDEIFDDLGIAKVLNKFRIFSPDFTVDNIQSCFAFAADSAQQTLRERGCRIKVLPHEINS